MWGWIAWVVVALAVWVVVAAVVGLLLGRIVRRRDQQATTSAPDSFPTPRASTRPPMSEPPMSERRPRS